MFHNVRGCNLIHIKFATDANIIEPCPRDVTFKVKDITVECVRRSL